MPKSLESSSTLQCWEGSGNGMKMNPLACGEVLLVASRLRQTAVKTKLASHQRVLARLCQGLLERVSGGNRAGPASPPQKQDIPTGCWGKEMQGQGAAAPGVGETHKGGRNSKFVSWSQGYAAKQRLAWPAVAFTTACPCGVRRQEPRKTY